MASHAAHGTLVANTPSTVTVTSANGVIEVMNRSANAEIYFTVGATDTGTPAPTVEGEDCYVVPEGLTSYVVHGIPATVVKLISSGTPKFSVIGGQA